MSRAGRYDVLLVGQTPPPLHGQAVVTAMLFDHDWGDLKVERLRLAYSSSIERVGKIELGKIWHLVMLIIQTWVIALVKNPKVFYYLPASANKAPVIRDVIYLTAVRWCFPKTVFHYHAGGLPEYLNNAGMLGEIAKRVYSNADVSIEISRTNFSPGEVFEAHKTEIISNGLNVNLINRQRPEGDTFRILFLGALNKGKGVLEVIRCAKLLNQGAQKIEFYLVGSWSSQEFKREAEQLVKSEGCSEVVFFPGSVDGLQKWQTYADADVFLFPSHYKSENFPLVVIEAMAFGLPIVTTKWRGIPQMVKGCDGVVLCDVNSPAQYADAIQKISNDDELHRRMGDSTRRHYHANYTSDIFLTKMEKVFSDLLD